MKDLDFCNLAIEQIGGHYGLPLQKGKAIEELGELIVALQKDILSSVMSSDNDNALSDEIVDEIADVTIVLKQLVKLSDSEDELNKRIVYKLTRQLDRLKAGDRSWI
nr:MAG TPA: nucleoside triphosphate pyrophosphohydrolase [Caudoviricetes sp.]